MVVVVVCCVGTLLLLQAKKRWEAEMKERGLSKDEAFMVETAQSAEIVSQHKSKKEKHKAAFGEGMDWTGRVFVSAVFAVSS